MLKESKNENQFLPPPKEKKKITFSDGLDITVIILVVVLFIGIILSFLAEFVLDAQIKWKEVGLDTGIVAACTIAIYLLLRSFAQRRGRKTERFTEARKNLETKNAEIIERDLARYASEYCRSWEKNRLDNDRKSILSTVGITLEEYESEYCKYADKELKNKFPKLTEIQLKAIKRARKVKTVKYDENYLFANRSRQNAFRKSPSGGITTRTLNILDYARTVLTTVCTSLFSASILQEVIFNPTRETVIKLVVKLAVIVTFAALGMVGGYNFATVKEVNEMNAKHDEMENFTKWCDGKRKCGE